jgi:hypothetical protein
MRQSSDWFGQGKAVSMALGSSGTAGGYRVRRSQGEGGGSGTVAASSTAADALASTPDDEINPLADIPEPGAETDFYLRRSYAIVERLRRAVSGRG